MSTEPGGALTVRPARREDAPAMAEICNQGVEDRVASFETDPRTAQDMERWFGGARAMISVEEEGVQVAAYAVAPLFRPP